MINNNKTNNDLQYQSKKQDFLHQKNVKAKTTFSLTFEFPVADCLHLRALVREEHSDLEKRRYQTCFMDIRIVLNKRRDVYNGY